MLKKRNLRWEEMDKSNVDLSVLTQHFDVHNLTEGKSPRTVGWHHNEALGLFIKWLDEHGFTKNLGSVGEPEVRRLNLYVKEKPGIKGPISCHSVSVRVRASRAFFAWSARKGYTKNHLLKDLHSPKTVERVIEPLNLVEVHNLVWAEGHANLRVAHRTLGFHSSGLPYKCRDKQTVISSTSEQLLTTYLHAMRRRTQFRAEEIEYVALLVCPLEAELLDSLKVVLHLTQVC